MSLSQLLNNFLNFWEFEPQLLINSILIRKNECISVLAGAQGLHLRYQRWNPRYQGFGTCWGTQPPVPEVEPPVQAFWQVLRDSTSGTCVLAGTGGFHLQYPCMELPCRGIRGSLEFATHNLHPEAKIFKGYNLRSQKNKGCWTLKAKKNKGWWPWRWKKDGMN